MRSKYEIKAQKELESENYRVDWKIRPRINPKTYNVDFFGLFDLIAHKKGERLRWISIKGRAGVPSKHRKEIEAFKLDKSNTKEIWSRSQSKKKYWNKVIIK